MKVVYLTSLYMYKISQKFGKQGGIIFGFLNLLTFVHSNNSGVNKKTRGARLSEPTGCCSAAALSSRCRCLTGVRFLSSGE
jgi:hypothetical protein